MLSFVKCARFIRFCRRVKSGKDQKHNLLQNGRFGRSPGSDAHGLRQLQASAAQAAVPNLSVAAAPRRRGHPEHTRLKITLTYVDRGNLPVSLTRDPCRWLEILLIFGDHDKNAGWNEGLIRHIDRSCALEMRCTLEAVCASG